MTKADAKKRAAIVAEAVSWELTPYASHQRLKGVAVDCIQMPVAVYSALRIIPDLNPEYGRQWMIHRDEEMYLDGVREWAKEVPVDSVQPGDLVIWKFGRTFSHSAIVVDPPIVIHAWARAGRVVRSDMTAEEDLKNRPCVAFSVFA